VKWGHQIKELDILNLRELKGVLAVLNPAHRATTGSPMGFLSNVAWIHTKMLFPLTSYKYFSASL